MSAQLETLKRRAQLAPSKKKKMVNNNVPPFFRVVGNKLVQYGMPKWVVKVSFLL